MFKISNKVISLSLATVLILTIAATTILAPNSAKAAATFTTYSILSVDPNPVGVGQTTVVNYQLNFPPLAQGLSLYHNMTIKVTDPSGVTTTYGPSTSNPNGGFVISFVPTTAGNYVIQGSYPGETTSQLNVLSSSSPITTLVVQTEPISGSPFQPIPTDYWTRPINAQHTNWASIAGDWLEPGYNATGTWYSGSSAVAPWTQSPLSAHVMWAAPFTLGGLVGGESGNAYGNGQVGTWSNLAGGNYATNGWPGIIMNGKVYYNTAFSSSGNPSNVPGMVCRDIRTGQILWQNTSAIVSFGTNYAIANINMYGVQDLLWDAHATGSWIVYDAFDGSIVHVFTNATYASGKPAPVIQPNGEVDFYTFGGAANKTTGGYDVWWAMWNSTRALNNSTGTNTGMTRGASNWQLGWQWNYTNNQPDNWQGVPSSVIYYSSGVFAAVTAGIGGTQDTIIQGYSATDGHLLWSHNQTFPGGINSRFGGGQGLYIQLAPSLLTEFAFDVNTGQNIWNTSTLAYPWGQFMTYGIVGFGKYYVGGYNGIQYCFDASKTGPAVREPLWQFYVGNTTDTPYGTWPIFNGPIVTQDACIFANAEHSPNMPLYRGEKMFAVNQTSGALLWNLTGWWSPISIADGYLFASNEYDNRVYSIGKGPTSMTVQAPLAAATQGQALTIQGTVMDQSAGQPNTPAISDNDMTAWMEYLYNGMPKPISAMGVPVSIDAYDPNGNLVHIADVTSDSSGLFSTVFTPDKAGPFRIIASFAGSNAYGSSSAIAAMNVIESAPSPTSTSQPTTENVINTIMIDVILAAIAIIIAIAIATLIIVRRK